MMCVTDWLRPLRSDSPASRPARPGRRRTGPPEALESRAAPTDLLGLVAVGALLGSAFDADESPSTPSAPPPLSLGRGAGGEGLPSTTVAPASDDSEAASPLATFEATVPRPFAGPRSAAPAVAPLFARASSSDLSPAAAFAPGLLDDLLAPPPTQPAAPPAPAPAARTPLIDSAPETRGGGGGGGLDAGGGGGAGDGSAGPGPFEESDFHNLDGGSGSGGGGSSGGGSSSGSGSSSGGGSGSGSGGGSGSGSGSGGSTPVAVDDMFWVNYTRQVVEAAYPGAMYGGPHVVANDELVGARQAVLVSAPGDVGTGRPGSAFTLHTNGHFSYTAPTDWDFSDTFTYKLVGDGGESNVATVTIGFRNGPPIGQDDGPYGVLADAPVTISAADGVLANDGDYERDAFPGSGLELYADLERDAVHGTVDLQDDGSFTYTPNDPDWYGPDSFAYRARDSFGAIDPYSEPTEVTIYVNDLHVFAGGNDITVDANYNVIIGQRAHLSTGFVGPGFGGRDAPTVVTAFWSIAGDIIKGYDLREEHYDSPLDHAQVTYLTAADLNSPDIDVYWIDGIDPATVFAAATVSLRGESHNIGAAGGVHVLEPTSMQLDSVTTTLIPPIDVRSDGFFSFGDDGFPGIDITGRLTPPNGGSGKVGFIQLGKFEEENSRWGQSWGSNGEFVLDDGELHDRTFYEPPKFVSPGNVGGDALVDSPGSDPTGSTFISRSDEFKAYFMYRPNGTDSIWVTVGLLEWNWHGSISRPTTLHNWTLGLTGYTVNPAGGASHELPEWTTTFGELF